MNSLSNFRHLYLSVCSILMFVVIGMMTGCSSGRMPDPKANEPVSTEKEQKKPKRPDYDTTQWREITFADSILVDIKYATTDNFIGEAIYPCGRCFLKPKAAQKLIDLNTLLMTKGYRLKVLDCYRPRDAQQKLWDKTPDPNYVANPAEGSMHSRGVAVDLTMCDIYGNELDMGSPYDHFGPEAHHTYDDLPQGIKSLRIILKANMERIGFQSIRTEWWHYSWTGTMPELDNWQWPCDKSK